MKKVEAPANPVVQQPIEQPVMQQPNEQPVVQQTDVNIQENENKDV